MKIYDFVLSPNCRKVRAVAYELGLQPTFVPVNIFKGEARTPAMLAVNPNGRLPVLQDGDFVLWESNTIVRYLAQGTHLLPTSARERADVERWGDWQLAHVGPAIGKVAFERLVKPMTGKGSPDAAVVEEASAEFAKHSAVLDASLGDKEWIAGKLSVADFIVASVYTVATTAGLDTAPFPKVHAWLGRVVARESMQRALADAQAMMAR